MPKIAIIARDHAVELKQMRPNQLRALKELLEVFDASIWLQEMSADEAAQVCRFAARLLQAA